MRIYKPAGRDGRNSKWIADVRLPNGKRTALTLFTSEKLSQEFANRLGAMIDQIAAGGSYDKHTQLWLSQVSPSMLKKFLKWGLVEQPRIAAGSPLDEQLAEWQAHIAASGASAKQAKQQYARAKRVFDEAGFKRVSDISVGKTLNAIDKLTVLVAGRGKVKNTGQSITSMSKLHYVRACKQFTRWLRAEGRIEANPLDTLAIKGAQVQNHRRALTSEEAVYLLEYVSGAAERFGMSGTERALIYQLALETGLRRNEIISLKRASFDFERLSVKVEAKHTKTRRAATLPIRAATMEKIKDHLAGKLPTAPAFGLGDNHTARMFQQDLTDARAAWIAEAKDDPQEHRRRCDSDFLKIQTYEGKLDFHALRHTFATFLVLNGIDIKTAQALLRHTTPAMTLAVYAYARNKNLVDAIEALPSFNAAVVQKAEKKKA